MANGPRKKAKTNGQITFRLGEEYAEVWDALERHAESTGGSSVNVVAREIVVAHVLSGGLKASGPQAAAPSETGTGTPRADLTEVVRAVREASDGARREQAENITQLRGDLVNLFRAILMKFEGLKREDVDRVVRTVFRAERPTPDTRG